MPKKCKDKRDRILKPGESQRKDLIYQYRYTDAIGCRKAIYDADLESLWRKELEMEKS